MMARATGYGTKAKWPTWEGLTPCIPLLQRPLREGQTKGLCA